MNERRDPNVTTDLPPAPADSFRAADVRLTTDHAPGSASADASHSGADAPADDLPAVPGYRVLREIARGGMGRVLAAYDLALDRDVALKILLPAANSDRFVRESKITARLPHPGIPPVHALGTLADGSPFLAMKLIAGRTLADEMKTADRPRLLQAFTQVCQAVGFAHSRGIIHRDLKPANVMVGAFGEVQVMDWGLAKELTGRERENDRRPPEARTVAVSGTDPDQTTDHAARESTDEQTQAGQVLGTPAYMAPEQARGEAADARADVFALGGILCAILTGRPPFSGKSLLEVIQRAGAADLAVAHARLDGCGADAELIALCRRCLSPSAADRPADGQAVADGLTAYLDGVQEKLRQAELAEAEARAKAVEQAKRWRLRVALAATVLLAVLLGGGAWLWWKLDRDARQAQVAREANEALAKAITLRAQARSATVGAVTLFAQAREQAQRARALVENGPADEALATRVRQLMIELDDEEKDRQLVADLDEANLAQVESSSETHIIGYEHAIPRFRKAFRAYGMPVGEGDPAEIAQRIRQRPVEVRDAILTALDEWVDLSGERGPNPEWHLNEPHREWLQAVLEAAEPDDGWTRAFRAARQEKNLFAYRAALEKLAAAADVSKLPPRALTRLARRLENGLARESALKLLRRAQKQRPGDYWVNHSLGAALMEIKPPQLEDAVRFLTVAVALRPDSAGPRNDLSLALAARGQMDEAVASLSGALAHHPKEITLHLNLASFLQRMGKLDEAIAQAREALDLDPNFAQTHSNLGALYLQKGLVDEAIASCRKAIELKPNLYTALTTLGGALNAKGRPDEAIPHLQKAIFLCRFFPSESALAHSNLGSSFFKKGQLDQAIACCKKAIALDPRCMEAHNNLGIALAGKGQLAEAIASYQKTIALNPKNAAAYTNMGNCLLNMGNAREAIDSCRKAVELNPNVAAHHLNLGSALAANSQIDDAIASYTKALAIDPNLSVAHAALGHALGAKGQTAKEIACYRKAIELDPRNVQALSNLGIVLSRKGQQHEAIALYKKAIAVDPTIYKVWLNMGLALTKTKGGSKEAIACFKKVIELDPKHARVRYFLGIELMNAGRREEAIASYRKAIELDPKHAYAHTNLGAMLLNKGEVDEAIACFQKAIALDPKETTACGALGTALIRVGRYAQAKESLERALALLPERDPLRRQASTQIQFCTRFLKVEARLPRLISGEEKPASAQEALEAAEICWKRNLTHAAARLRTAAFAADPKLADDLSRGYRYDAACEAALAAAGKGKDAGNLDDKERARLRKQALDWLRAELTALEKRLKSGQPADRAEVQRNIKQWQQDSELSGIRDRAALDKLPPDEQKAFTQFWADVATLLKKSETPAKTGGN